MARLLSRMQREQQRRIFFPPHVNEAWKKDYHQRKSLESQYIHPKDYVCRWKLKRGDEVEVIRGQHTGERGRVVSLDRKRNLVYVKGVNLVRRNVGDSSGASQVVMAEEPISFSTVALIDPKTDQPTRVKWQTVPADGADGAGTVRVRVSCSTGERIPEPADEFRSKLSARAAFRLELKRLGGPKDTPPALVVHPTFDPATLYPRLTIGDVYPDAPEDIRALSTLPESIPWPGDGAGAALLRRLRQKAARTAISAQRMAARPALRLPLGTRPHHTQLRGRPEPAPTRTQASMPLESAADVSGEAT